jgi:hypothetical protein
MATLFLHSCTYRNEKLYAGRFVTTEARAVVKLLLNIAKEMFQIK